MVQWFNSLTIKWKLAFITACTTAAALLLSGAIAVVIDTRTYERHKLDEITAIANVVAGNVVGAVVFNDSEIATRALASLAANREIQAGAAYDADGNAVASYARTEQMRSRIPAHAPSSHSALTGATIAVAAPILQSKSTVGTVFLSADLESTATRISREALTLLLVGIGCLALALPASMRLHRTVSDPVEELAANNAIIQATLESVDHGVFVVDRNLRVSFINDKVQSLFGGVLEGLAVGADLRSFADTWQAQTLNQSEISAEEVTKRQLNEAHRHEYQLASGRTVEYRHSPLPGGGFVRTYTDVTDERTFQQTLKDAKARAEEADRAKSAFLAAMSHEIRTPMNGVIGVLELLHATSLSPDQRQMVDIIRQSGGSLLDVINDILDYSKIEAGRMNIELTSFALGEVLESTAKAISGHTKSKTLDVLCTIDPEIDWHVKGDPVRVRQIILNLMGNALKFTEMGSVELEAICESQTVRTNVVRVEVRDTGIGIPADKMGRLFERFSQADHSTTRQFGGTGLGLSIAKHLVELMGGRIGVESTPGRGSTFWFTIPFARLPEGERTATFARHGESLKNVKAIICDRTATKSAAALYLGAAGAKVIETHSVGQIVEHYYEEDRKGQTPDLIILKVRIGEDSVSLLTSELSKRKGLENVKVLLVLPHMSASAAKPLGTSNPNAVIYSPMGRTELYEAVASLCGRTKVAAISSAQHLDFDSPSLEDAVSNKCLILVAEDNETNQFVIRTQLRRLGYAAEFAGDGQEAWNLIKLNPTRYGLLLTDCHMPFVDGYQLTRLVREAEKSSSRHMPVIALTANALEGESDLCLAAGMDDYLSKPVLLSALDQRIQKWLPRAAELRRPARAPASKSNGHADTIITVPSQQQTAPPIDVSKLAEMVGNDDPAYLREMLGVFWETMADTPGAFRKLARSRDAKNLALAAHAAKGAAASACAVTLADLCKRLELAAHAERWDEIESLSPEISEAFDEIEDFVMSERQTEAAG